MPLVRPLDRNRLPAPVSITGNPSGGSLAKPNFGIETRQRELEKKRKKEEKRQRQLDRKSPPSDEDATAADEGDR